jgi:hypothetical protein
MKDRMFGVGSRDRSVFMERVRQAYRETPLVTVGQS